MLKLFDSIIKPILLYSSDFWGCLNLPKNKPIENLHFTFCKHLLGVQKGTTNVGVLLELGWTPLTLDAQKAAIKNWERIRNKKANYLVTLSYINAEQNSLEWSTKVKSCLEQNGMLSSHTRAPPHPCLNTHTKLYKRLSDVFYQPAFESINKQDSKLRTYLLIKDSVEIENYLITTRNINARVCLTKFRLSNHKLMIETGRHQKVPITERFCPFCYGMVEDEIHFLINCKQYDTLRGPILKESREARKNFSYYSNKEKFMFIMTYNLFSDKLAKFISDAIEIRDSNLNEAWKSQSHCANRSYKLLFISYYLLATV